MPFNTADGQQRMLPIKFFKLIHQEWLKTLRLPKDFSALVEDSLPNPIVLSPPDGSEWSVSWERRGEYLFLTTGWSRFVAHYTLQVNYSAVFEYIGWAKFNVIVFHRGGLELHSPDNQHYPRKRKRDVDEGDSHPKTQTSVDKYTRPENSLNWPDDADTQELACNFQTTNYFFILKLKRSDLTKKALYNVPKIPTIPSKDYKILLSVGDTCWSARFKTWGQNGFGIIHDGWYEFASDNKLKIGDTCLFELVNPSLAKFEVHIIAQIE